jgi:hypothetical protein
VDDGVPVLLLFSRLKKEKEKEEQKNKNWLVFELEGCPGKEEKVEGSSTTYKKK